MRSTLRDPDLDAALDRYGFVVVPFLDPPLIEEMMALLREVGPAPGDPGIALYFGFHSESPDYKRTVRDGLQAKVLPLTAGLLEDYENFFAMFITKWPGDRSGFGPHQDPTLINEDRFRGVTIWCPLVDTAIVDGKDNGMLHVVPGSHRFLDAPRVHDASEFVFEGTESAILEEHGVAVPTRAGEAIIFDHRLIHYSMPNETEDPRVVVAFGMRPRETTCLHLRYDPAGMIDVYEVGDEYFVDVNPFALHFGVPGYDPIAKVEPMRERLTPDEFGAKCRDVDPAPRAVPARRAPGVATRVNAAPFCFLCGGTRGLDDVERTDRGNVQVLCSDCAEELDGRYTSEGFPLGERTDEQGPAELTVEDDARPGPRWYPGAPLRLLFVGAAPTVDADMERVRELVRALHLRSDVRVTTTWLLGGDGRRAWADACERLVVVDDLRTWPLARAADRVSPIAGGKLRGAKLGRDLRRLGGFDVAVLHQGLGRRVLDRLDHAPALTAALWTRGGTPAATREDHVSDDVDLWVLEAGMTVEAAGDPMATVRLGNPRLAATAAQSLVDLVQTRRRGHLEFV